MTSQPTPSTAAPPRIYLDYNATTPLDPAVFEAMKPYFLEHFGNPASGQHAWGWTAEAAATRARTQVATLIGAQATEIYFTSGATEGNNTAFLGLVQQIRQEQSDAPIHVLTSTVEHSSVMNVARALLSFGVEVDFLPVDAHGRVSPDQVRAALKPHTRLMSFIWANNEIGSLNPMRELAAIAKENRIYLHTDATQAVGKIPVNVDEVPVDMMTFSSHKFYGPKGVGALYLRARDPAVRIQPLLHGGGHERGLRSGTLNVPGIVGFGKAAEIAQHSMPAELERCRRLQALLIEGVLNGVPGARLNGHPTERSPINVSLMMGKPTELALPKLQRLGFSTGSACSAGRVSVSHVLAGLGLSDAQATATIRLSIGRWTTEAEIDEAVRLLTAAFN